MSVPDEAARLAYLAHRRRIVALDEWLGYALLLALWHFGFPFWSLFVVGGLVVLALVIGYTSLWRLERRWL